MAKHRLAIIGAGRIGAGYHWHDDAYTHAGAAQALKDRIELVGFIEADNDRATAAKQKWNVPVYEDIPTGLMALRPDVLSICVQPEQQNAVYMQLHMKGIKGIWQEKPFTVPLKEWGVPIQVNYLRRGDPVHRKLAYELIPRRKEVKLVVYGKDDIHTRCHFDDLQKWWGVEMDYRPFSGPCAYAIGRMFFDNGGVERPGDAMKAMLENLLNHIDHGMTLWSPANGTVS